MHQLLQPCLQIYVISNQACSYWKNRWSPSRNYKCTRTWSVSPRGKHAPCGRNPFARMNTCILPLVLFGTEQWGSLFPRPRNPSLRCRQGALVAAPVPSWRLVWAGSGAACSPDQGPSPGEWSGVLPHCSRPLSAGPGGDQSSCISPYICQTRTTLVWGRHREWGRRGSCRWNICIASPARKTSDKFLLLEMNSCLRPKSSMKSHYCEKNILSSALKSTSLSHYITLISPPPPL